MRGRLFIVLGLLAVGCKHGVGIHIKGRIDRAWSGATARQPDGSCGGVDGVVAMPHDRGTVTPDLFGQEVVVDTVPGDTFDLDVDPNRDYVVMLVDRPTGDLPCVAGYVTMQGDQATAADFVISEADGNLQLETVTQDGTEAVSEATLDDLASSFSLSVDQLTALAHADDGVLDVGNAWVNWHPDTGVYYRFNGAFGFTAPLASDGSADPDSLRYDATFLQIDTHDPALVGGFEQICSGDIAVALVPPGPITDERTGESWGPDDPPDNSGTLTRWADDTCGDTAFTAYRAGNAEVWLAFAGQRATGDLEGMWSLQVDGDEVASYDLAVNRPLRDGRPDTLVVDPQLVIGSDGVVERVDLTYRYWDGAAWQEASSDLVDRLATGSFVELSDFAGAVDPAEPSGDTILTSWTPQDAWVIGAPAPGQRSIDRLTAGFEIGGQQHRYEFVSADQTSCGDHVRNGDEECDGLDFGTQTCADFGLYQPGQLACTGSCTLDTSGCSPGLVTDQVSGPHLAFSATTGIETNTVAFTIDNEAYDFTGIDLWASLSGDPALADRLPLADEEDGVAHVGRLAYGDRALVAFQVKAPGGGTASERLVLSDGPPDALNPPSVVWEGPLASWIVRTAQDTTASAVTSVALPDDGAPLGATERVVVRGTADALGGTGRLDLNAATSAAWKADHTELEGVSLEVWDAGTTTPTRLCLDAACTAEANPAADTLVVWAPDATAVDWQATLSFRVAATLPDQVTSTALVHDSATGLQGPSSAVPGAGMFPAANALQVSVEDPVVQPSLADPTAFVLVDVVNPTAWDVDVDEVGFALPDHVDGTGTVRWDDGTGTAFDWPAVVLDTGDGGRALVHRGRLRVPAHGQASFQAEVVLDETIGVYDIAPRVGIGDTDIPVDQPMVLVFDGSESSCTAGTWYDTGNSACVACPDGTTSVAGSGDVSECFACPAGTWLDGAECTPCPAGTTSPPGSTSLADCAMLLLPPTVVSVDFSPRYDHGIDVLAGGAVTLSAEVTSDSGPVTQLVYALDGPSGFHEVHLATPDTPLTWIVDPADPLGAYTVTVVAFNAVGGSDPFVLDEPIDVGTAGDDAWGVLRADPDHLRVGFDQGDSGVLPVTLTNVGLAALTDLELTLAGPGGGAAPGWMTFSSGATIAQLDVGAQATAQIQFSPDASAPLSGATPDDYVIEARAAGDLVAAVPLSVWVDPPGLGAWQFKVEDQLTGTYDDQGNLIQGVAGAAIRIDRLEGSPHSALLLTDTAGEAFFEDLPVGDYRYQVQTPAHDPETGVVHVEGVAESTYAYLDQTEGLRGFEPGYTVVDDDYTGTLSVTLDASSPAASGSAPVDLALPVDLTVERQAYDLAISLYNPDPALPMEDVAVTVGATARDGTSVPVSTDPNAASGSATFFVTEGTHDGIASVDGTSALAADSMATVHMTLVPAPEADDPRFLDGTPYFTTATARWVRDGVSYEETIDGPPVYVLPEPDLWLDAHANAVWVGDNAYTDPVEPSEAATVGLRVANRRADTTPAVGLGTGTLAVDDAAGHGLLATVSGGAVDDVALVDPTVADLGTLDGGTARMLAWSIESSLLARATAVSVELVHDPALGGLLTSLVRAGDDVCTAGAVRGDAPGRDAVTDVLSLGTCDGADGLALYESDLVDLPVVLRTAGQTSWFREMYGVYDLTVPSVAGWMHARVPVPAEAASLTLSSCERQDGKVLDPANCWIDTDYTTGSDCGTEPVCATPVIALFDDADPTAPKYTLTFVP